jgi:adenylate cyclase
VPERDRRKGKLSEAIRRAVAQQIAGTLRERPDVLDKIKENPEAVERLEALGVLDQGMLDPEAWEEDPVGILRRAARGLAQAVRDRPSVLSDLGVNALDVMSLDEHGPAALPGAERHDLTVVFTDLQGFTAFTTSQGDDEATRLLSSHYASVDKLVRARGGRVVKRLGDGHLVTFPAAEAAVMSSLELVEAAPTDLALRAGAHAGEVTPIGADLVGTVVNLASRVAGEATGGETLVTGEVRGRTGPLPGVEFGVERPTRLKGFDDPVALVPVRRV